MHVEERHLHAACTVVNPQDSSVSRVSIGLSETIGSTGFESRGTSTSIVITAPFACGRGIVLPPSSGTS